MAGRYRLTGVLGRGGMGVVWRAADELIGRTVAVKELRAPHGLSDQERAVFSERALREARTAGRVNHPAVVGIYDLVPPTSADDAVYIVMELVEAPSLAEALDRERSLPEWRVARLGLRMLEALNAAHAIGLVHRDIKPSNILVLPGDKAKLVDFGIAHAVDDTRLTRHGVAGSTGYMAPELFEGESPTPATDLWSLGATLFHAVAGTGPFDRASTAATLHAILYDEVPTLDGYPLLAPLIGGLLTRDRTHRMTSEQAATMLRTVNNVAPSSPDRHDALGPGLHQAGAEADSSRPAWEGHPTTARAAATSQQQNPPGEQNQSAAAGGEAAWESSPTTVRPTPPSTPHRPTPETPGEGRFVRSASVAGAVLALGQLTVVLNTTIAEALNLYREFHGSLSDDEWLYRSYALAFCSLLLLGARAGDIFGRTRMLRIGLTVFVLASLLGGLAPNPALLISARFGQGVGAALVAPNALALIATTFPAGKQRSRAMGAYAAMAGAGTAIGLVLGYALTDGPGWRWVFFVNVLIGLIVLAGTKVLVNSERQHGRLNIVSTLTATGALIALLYGIPPIPAHHATTMLGIVAPSWYWTEDSSLISFGVAAALFMFFLIIQVRTRHPMATRRLTMNCNLWSSLATMLLAAAGMSWAFFWMLDGVQAELFHLPFIVGVCGAASFALAFVGGFAFRLLAGVGLLVAGGGMFWFSMGSPLTAPWPAFLVIGVGLGLVFVPITLGALSGMGQEEAGVASGLLNTAQQIGGMAGLVILSTVYMSVIHRSRNEAIGPEPDIEELFDHGHHVAALGAAGLLLLGLVIAMITVRGKAQRRSGDEA
ncbi:MDR family MFS transporter [Streptomyces rimosus]|uniref:MDR family MFS transporter n=1 Tax=Streptomyces rimosus TaxID=1927 RepID=UPI0022772684|nr:MDR family MFS transporter [Streptomyces rimosus]